jgi:16S rRNA (cytidine1402-2'-O)-methyltransferase
MTTTVNTPATLHLVATPIGNLGDLTPRAADTLSRVELICCEDTRRTGRLLQHIGHHRGRMAICNEHTEMSRIAEVLEMLDAGAEVALVSDAGTPAISDPGYRLVRAVVAAGHRVSPIPGPNAAIAALVASGLAPDRFVFEGFLPRRGGERHDRLAEIAAERRTTVIYESPQRVERLIDDLTEICGPDRAVVVARELTKLHEEIVHGSLGTIALGDTRGEYVIVLDGAPEPGPPGDDEVHSALSAALRDGLSTRDAAREVAGRLGVARRDVYALAVAMSASDTSRSSIDHNTDHSIDHRERMGGDE